MYKHRTNVLTEVCDRFHTALSDIEGRMENLELNACKRMVIVTGLFVLSDKRDKIIEELHSFIEDNMGINTQIDDVFRLGKSEPKPIVITFQSIAEKKQVMKNKSALKDSGQTRVYINDYIPVMTQEKRRQEHEVVAMAKQVVTSNGKQVDTKYYKGKLVINGHYYQPKVVPPTPKDLVDIDLKDLDRIQKMKLKKSQPFVSEGSRFTAYVSLDVKNHQDIRDLYKKVKILEPAARHIPCAYWLPGAETYYTQSFTDDGEPGSGRVLLETLMKYGSQGSVIFGARKYGGIKLGTDRFDLYAKSAIQALGGDPEAPRKQPSPRPVPGDQVAAVRKTSPIQQQLDQMREQESFMQIEQQNQSQTRPYYPRRSRSNRRAMYGRSTGLSRCPAYSRGPRRGTDTLRGGRVSTQHRTDRHDMDNTFQKRLDFMFSKPQSVNGRESEYRDWSNG